jgi:ubiquinone/menaquinone biosynthesis C-methylase UbiE
MQIADHFGAKGYGVDPSSLAIKEAIADYPVNASFSVATAENLPFKQNQFDLVHFGFCLYLVDRDLLFQALSEADRVLRSGGFLVITDFDASLPSRTPYRHKDGIMSFRNDYAGIYMSSGHFSLVSKFSYSHTSEFFDADLSERVSTQILFKEPDPYLQK